MNAGNRLLGIFFVISLVIISQSSLPGLSISSKDIRNQKMKNTWLQLLYLTFPPLNKCFFNKTMSLQVDQAAVKPPNEILRHTILPPVNAQCLVSFRVT